MVAARHPEHLLPEFFSRTFHRQDKVRLRYCHSQFAKCAETRDGGDLQIFSLTLSKLSYRGSGCRIRQSFSPRHPRRTSNMFKTGFRCPLSENLSTVAIAQLAARRSHNPKVASSILTRHMLPEARIMPLDQTASECFFRQPMTTFELACGWIVAQS